MDEFADARWFLTMLKGIQNDRDKRTERERKENRRDAF